MLNDRMFKPNNKTCLKCKYRLKQETITSEKNVVTEKTAFIENWV